MDKKILIGKIKKAGMVDLLKLKDEILSQLGSSKAGTKEKKEAE